MITVLACDRDQKETERIREDCSSSTAMHSDESMRFDTVSAGEEFSGALKDGRLIDLCYFEFVKGQTVDALREFRRQYGDSMLMLITESTVSPLEYLKPGVAPDSLLLRPYTEDSFRVLNREFMDSFFEKFQAKDAEQSFVVDTREEKIFIPYSRIYYFEARDKKLFVRTKTEEYAFYDTIEALLARLPEQFRRCHRSYIVNTEKISRILNSENYIELTKEIGVPLSRSCKAAFKGGTG